MPLLLPCDAVFLPVSCDATFLAGAVEFSVFLALPQLSPVLAVDLAADSVFEGFLGGSFSSGSFLTFSAGAFVEVVLVVGTVFEVVALVIVAAGAEALGLALSFELYYKF